MEAVAQFGYTRGAACALRASSHSADALHPLVKLASLALESRLVNVPSP